MMKFVTNLSFPALFRELFFLGKYTALLQLLLGFAFALWACNGGPMGCLATAEGLAGAGLVTLTITLSFQILVSRILRKTASL